VRRLLAAKPPRLSRPLLETVAIIAYRQPITRPEIELLRGVDCGGVLDTLTERNLIKIDGRKEAPGRPLLYATTPEFLELFGLKDLASLPDLAELRAVEVPRDETGPGYDDNAMPIDEAADALAQRAAEPSDIPTADAAPAEPIDSEAASEAEPLESSDPIKSTDQE
jgi:segregation and condensation protein B